MTTNFEDMATDVKPTEAELLESLKNKCRLVGLTHSPNIGYETLLTKYNEYMTAVDARDKRMDGTTLPASTRQHHIEAAHKLVRVIITPHDPRYAQLDGIMQFSGNRVVPTFGKYVPFNVVWHVPEIILQHLSSMEFSHFRSKRGSKNNVARTVEAESRKSFSIERLPPITQEEMDKIALRQKQYGNVEEAEGY